MYNKLFVGEQEKFEIFSKNLEIFKPDLRFSQWPQDLKFKFMNTTITQGNTTVIKSGKRLILDCFYYGKPRPEDKWFYNSKELDLDRLEFSLNADKGLFHIIHTSKLYSGKYECCFSNGNKTINRLFEIDVEESLSLVTLITFSIFLLIALFLMVLLVCMVISVVKGKKINKKLRVNFIFIEFFSSSFKF
jgi:hypothetical protein